MKIETNFSLQAYNTFGVAATASAYAEVATKNDVLELYHLPYRPIYILGGGSNVLMLKDIEGIVLRNCLMGIEVLSEREGHVLVAVGAGENWHELVQWAIRQNLGGLENLSLIPGTVGAAPIQNIGAYGVELKDVFHSLEAFDFQKGTFRNFDRDACQFGYRYSIFKEAKNRHRFLITRVVLQLTRPPHPLQLSYGAIQETLKANGISRPGIREVGNVVESIRKSKLPDPKILKNAGSFFKNPEIESGQFDKLKEKYPEVPGYPTVAGQIKVAAGWLIEACGWKGKRHGRVGCHEKQALVIVNYGGASGAEIQELARAIQVSVKEKFGIYLEPEVNFWS